MSLTNVESTMMLHLVTPTPLAGEMLTHGSEATATHSEAEDTCRYSVPPSAPIVISFVSTESAPTPSSSSRHEVKSIATMANNIVSFFISSVFI